jgi:UDP-glucose 4-epimerase
MKVLVVGGAGYIGSHVARALLDNGYDVAVYDNLSTGTRDNLFDDGTFLEGDILDYTALCAAMQQRIDSVVHLAAFKAAGESMEKPEKYSVNNIIGTINILNAASDAGVKRVVFSSSAAVYGNPRYTPIDEKHPLEPINYYGFTKLEIERLLEWYDRLREIKFASLRYFNAAGYDPEGRIRGFERNPANLLPIIMEVAAGIRPKMQVYGNDYSTRDGTCIRDYIHVTDLADAHVRAVRYLDENKKSCSVNLSTQRGTTVLEMITRARQITGKPIEAEITGRRPGDPDELVASAEKARELLGWEPRYSDLDTLINSTWRKYAGR